MVYILHLLQTRQVEKDLKHTTVRSDHDGEFKNEFFKKTFSKKRIFLSISPHIEIYSKSNCRREKCISIRDGLNHDHNEKKCYELWKGRKFNQKCYKNKLKKRAWK